MKLLDHRIWIVLIYFFILNLVFFTCFILIWWFWFPDYKLFLPITLVAYLTLSQPLKDLGFVEMIKRKLYASRWKFSYLENQVHQVVEPEQIPNFFQIIVQKLELSPLYLYLHIPDKVLLKFYPDKAPDRITKIEEVTQIANHVKNIPCARFTILLTKKQRAFTESYGIGFILPIHFRNFQIGFIGLSEQPSKETIATLEFVARHVSLVIENDFLKKVNQKKKLIINEIKVAKKIESLLLPEEDIFIYSYKLHRPARLKQKVHFSVIFDHLFQDDLAFAFILKIDNLSNQYSYHELFALRGYFFSIARSALNIEELLSGLHQALRRFEKVNTFAEGIVLQVDKSSFFRVAIFGKNVTIKLPIEWKIADSLPLGYGEKFATKIHELVSPMYIVVNIDDYPVMLITK